MLDCVWKGCTRLWVFIVYFSNISALSWLLYILRKKPRHYITNDPMQFHAFGVWKYYQLGVGVGRESSSWVRDINICCPESITRYCKHSATYYKFISEIWSTKRATRIFAVVFLLVLYSPKTNVFFLLISNCKSNTPLTSVIVNFKLQEI